MGFWTFSFCMSIAIPISMIAMGHHLYKHCPSRKNGIGYLTSTSNRNDNTWKFANEYFGKLWYFWGRVLLIPSAVLMLFTIGKEIEPVGICMAAIVVIQLVFMIACIFPTERALKKTFDKYGLYKKH